MTEITSRLSTALADRYQIGRELGSGGMATVYPRRGLEAQAQGGGQGVAPRNGQESFSVTVVMPATRSSPEE